MEFNLDKWERLHFSKTNHGRTCTVNGNALGNVAEQSPRVTGTYFYENNDTISQGDEEHF